MALVLYEQDAQTPFDPDEKAGQIPTPLETQDQLNDWEQQNIFFATKWLKRAEIPNVLTESFCRDLHRKMFDKT